MSDLKMAAEILTAMSNGEGITAPSSEEMYLDYTCVQEEETIQESGDENVTEISIHELKQDAPEQREYKVDELFLVSLKV